MADSHVRSTQDAEELRKSAAGEAPTDARRDQSSADSTRFAPNTSASVGTSIAPQEKDATPLMKPSLNYVSIEAFVRHCYNLRGRRVILKVAQAKALGEAPPVDLAGTIVELVKTDPLLAVPSQVLLAGSSHRDLHRVWPPLKTVFLQALKAHPATMDIVHGLESGITDRALPEPVFETLATRDFTATRFSINGRLSKSKAAKLRQNAIHAASLWVVLVGSSDLADLIRYLNHVYWSEQLSKTRTVKDRLQAFMQTTDPVQAGLLCSAFVDQLKRFEREAAAAAQRESESIQRIDNLQLQLQSLNEHTTAQSAQIDEMKSTIQRMVADHSATISHARDDLERLRARIALRIESDLELLAEGLSAIRRDPPRIHVMEDHAERAIQKLKAELETLRSEDI